MRYAIVIQKFIWASNDEEAFNQVKEIENEKDDCCKVLSICEAPHGQMKTRELELKN